jgi:caa(3)-type oxidase subunit IV
MSQVRGDAQTARASRGLSYGSVFLLLALVTALEVWLGNLGLMRSARAPVFLILSLFKASMVAAYYMHLRSDSRLYAYILVTPAILLLAFTLIASVP